jgi:hypothetical protein
MLSHNGLKRALSPNAVVPTAYAAGQVLSHASRARQGFGFAGTTKWFAQKLRKADSSRASALRASITTEVVTYRTRSE